MGGRYEDELEGDDDWRDWRDWADPDREGAEDLSDEVRDRIWAEILRRLDLTQEEADWMASQPLPPPFPPPSRHHRRRRRRRRLLVAAGVACLLLLVGVVVTRQDHSNGSDVVAAGPTASIVHDPHPPAPGSPELDELVAAAQAHPGARLDADHPYVHLVVEVRPASEMADGWIAESWIAADGSGRRSVRPLSEDGDPGQEREEPEPRALVVAGLTPEEIVALPAEADALLAALAEATEVADGGPPAADVVVDVLAAPVLRSASRAALVGALDQLGFTVVGPTTDALGRAGVALVSETPDGDRVELVLDRATARPLSLEVGRAGVPSPSPALTLYRVAEVAAG